MAVRPGNYQRRIFNGSGLDTESRFIAIYLSRKASTDADAFGWFDVTQSEIATALAIRSRETVRARLNALDELGWIERQPVTAGNRYQSTRYRLALPVKARPMAPKPRNRGMFSSENQPSLMTVPPSPRQAVDNPSLMTVPPSPRTPVSVTVPPSNIDGPTVNELRSSSNKSVATTQPAAEEEPTTKRTPSRTPLSTPTPGSVVATADEIHDAWDEQRSDEQTQALAYPRQPTDYLAAHCAECGAESGQDCLGLPAPARPRLDPIRGRPRMHYARIAPSLAALAGVAS